MLAFMKICKNVSRLENTASKIISVEQIYICCSKFFKAEVYETLKVNYFILLQKYPPFRKPFLENLQYSLLSILTLKQVRIYLTLLRVQRIQTIT